jgi:ribonuclease HI
MTFLDSLAARRRWGMRPGLERMRAVLSALGDPQKKIAAVHVAGTNGKGSCCAMIGRVLRESGYKTGMYTSPYIERHNERIRIGGVPIEGEKLAALVERVWPVVESLREEGLCITEFELGTVLAFLAFAQEKVDIAIIEVGLGGRLDPTNIITPLVSVITEVGMDHMGFLGNTIGEIAKMAKGKKVYAVKKGRTTGLFMTWDDCKAQVDGFAGAEYKSFADPAEAMAYLGLSPQTAGSGTGTGAAGAEFPEGVVAYVDGSYDAASGRFSCGVVIIETDANGNSETTELNSAFDDAEAAAQRNVAGEIMGSKLAIDWCMANGVKSVEIYHDYEGIGAWADRRWKANNPLTQGYRDYVAEARKTLEIKFVKVKGHSGNKYNDMADKLAKAALQ